MILPKPPLSPPLWFLFWILLFQNNPLEASEPEVPQVLHHIQPSPLDLHPLKEVAQIAGTCSIITSIIWSVGIVLSARYKYKERNTSSCGAPSSES